MPFISSGSVFLNNLFPHQVVLFSHFVLLTQLIILLFSMYLPCMSLMLFHLLALVYFNDETDKQALVEFQTHLTENSRLVLASWNKSFHLCNWTGIICGRRHRRVTGLDLSGMKLTGVISPSIGNLSFLTSLIQASTLEPKQQRSWKE